MGHFSLLPFILSLLLNPTSLTMEDITSKWDRLSLNQIENQTVSLTPTVTGNGKVLVAKFFTKRRIDMEAILRTLKSMWKTKKSFDIGDLSSNMVLILFDEEYDLDHILMHGPWSFDKYLLSLYKLERNESVKNAQFDRASFWVQIHDLPIQHTNKVNAKAIGNSVVSLNRWMLLQRGTVVIDVSAFVLTLILVQLCVKVSR